MSDNISSESAAKKMSASGVGVVEEESCESGMDSSADFGNSGGGDGHSSGATSTTVVEDDEGSSADESGSLEVVEEGEPGSESSDAEQTGSESTSSASGGSQPSETSGGESEPEQDAVDGELEEVNAEQADWEYVDRRLQESESLERAFNLEENKAYVTKFTSRRYLKNVVKKNKTKPELVLMTEWTCSYCRKFRFENVRMKSHKLNGHLKQCEAYKNRTQRRAQGSRLRRHGVCVPRPEEGVPAFDVTGRVHVHRGLINTLIDRTEEHERRLEKLEEASQSRKNEIMKIVKQCLPGILKDLKQVKITGSDSIQFTPAGSSTFAVDPEQRIIPTPPPEQSDQHVRAAELARPPLRAFNPDTFTARELEMIGVRPGSKRVKSKKNTSKKD